MNILKFILASLVSLSLISCGGHEQLTKDDFKWMPYTGNETLIFLSNTGEIDTIFLIAKDTLFAYAEPQAFGSKIYDIVSIQCKHTDTWPPDGKHRYLINEFMQLAKSEDGKTRIDINLAAKNAHFYKSNGTKIDSLDRLKPTKLSTKSNTYNDVYIIEDEDWVNFKNRTDYITKIYWSKSKGLIRYDKKDSVYWELSK